MSKELGLKWDEAQVFAFLEREFPQVFGQGRNYEVEELSPQRVRVGFEAAKGQLRPGGTVSGPTQFELADLAFYFLLLALHGEKAALAVTTNTSCSFVRKPHPGRLVCEATLIKHGRTLAVAAARIFDKDDRLVANLELTYFVGVVYTD